MWRHSEVSVVLRDFLVILWQSFTTVYLASTLMQRVPSEGEEKNLLLVRWERRPVDTALWMAVRGEEERNRGVTIENSWPKHGFRKKKNLPHCDLCWS